MGLMMGLGIGTGIVVGNNPYKTALKGLDENSSQFTRCLLLKLVLVDENKEKHTLCSKQKTCSQLDIAVASEVCCNTILFTKPKITKLGITNKRHALPH